MNDTALKSHQLYINRELSFLEFNWRVLAQGRDDSLPLLERVKLLGISCSNLDEFFEIRVAGLKQRKELGSRAAARWIASSWTSTSMPSGPPARGRAGADSARS